MESEYKSIRRSVAQFRSIDLVLTCVDIGMLAFSLKEAVGCVPAGLSEMHRSVGRVRATKPVPHVESPLQPWDRLPATGFCRSFCDRSLFGNVAPPSLSDPACAL